MMITALRLVAVAALVAVLSACNVTIFIGDDVDETVTAVEHTGASLTDAPEADTAVLGSGEERVYRVNLPSTDRHALYLYLDDELDMYVYRDSGGLYATSSGEDFFASGTAGLSGASGGDELAPSDITANLVCPGSCVIVRSSLSDPVYVSVRNTTGSDRDMAFYATLRDFEDESETAGDPLLVGPSGARGALEVLGDTDTFEIEQNGTLELLGNLASGIVFEAEITDPLDPDKPARYIRDEESTSVLAFEEVRVYAVNDRAGAAGKSSYDLLLD